MPRFTRVPGLVCLVCLLTCAGTRAEADCTGCGTGVGFTLNGDAVGQPTISHGVLTLTNGLGSEARSSFPTIAQNLTGSNTANVGFTGGTGAFTATPTISDVSFTNATTVPEPTSLVLLSVAGAGALAYRRRRGR